jgi:hypothetical protein
VGGVNAVFRTTTTFALPKKPLGPRLAVLQRDRRPDTPSPPIQTLLPALRYRRSLSTRCANPKLPPQALPKDDQRRSLQRTAVTSSATRHALPKEATTHRAERSGQVHGFFQARRTQGPTMPVATPSRSRSPGLPPLSLDQRRSPRQSHLRSASEETRSHKGNTRTM